MGILQDLNKDVNFYYSLRFPGRQPSVFSWIWVLLSSRGLFVITVQRISHRNFNLRPSSTSEKILKLYFRILLKGGVYFSRILTKSEFLPITVIDAGVFLSNNGHIILGTRAIGSGTVIHNRVTIGKNNIGDRSLPVIGRNVWIGSHSVIYGNISIGDGVTLLPGTVITRSVPPGVVMQGNPARVIKRLHDNAALRSTFSTEVSCMMGDDFQVEN